MKLSLKYARNLIIEAQGLHCDFKTPLQVLRKLGYIQIDTISVVQRAHHHVFWSRCSKYKPNDLDKLVKSRKAFEYWSHAAAYLPIEDYRYSLYLKNRFKKKSSSWFPRDPKLMKYVYDRIKTEGPLQSKDFKNEKGRRSGWWDWKPAKKALERLFMEGELDISERINFQKVYDLRERVIPSQVDQSLPSDSEYARYLIRRTLEHHAFAAPKEMAYLEKSEMKKIVKKEINSLVEEGKVLKVEIEGIKEPYYILKKGLNELHTKRKNVHILSPFDNLVIQRDKLKNLFKFDYQIECYVPEPKRKFGYFSLPILVDQDFVARVDCKADRKVGELRIKSFHWEKREYRTKHQTRVWKKLDEFAKFNSCVLHSKSI